MGLKQPYRFIPNAAVDPRHQVGKSLYLKTHETSGEILAIRPDGYVVKLKSRRLGVEDPVIFVKKEEI